MMIGNNVDIVLTKNISHFCKDSVEVLTAIEKLVDARVRVLFITEGIDMMLSNDKCAGNVILFKKTYIVNVICRRRTILQLFRMQYSKLYRWK